MARLAAADDYARRVVSVSESNQHSSYVSAITEAFQTGLYDDPPDEAKIVAGKDALENLVEQLETVQRERDVALRDAREFYEQRERALGGGETGAQPSVGTTRATTSDLGPTASTDSPQDSFPAKRPT